MFIRVCAWVGTQYCVGMWNVLQYRAVRRKMAEVFLQVHWGTYKKTVVGALFFMVCGVGYAYRLIHFYLRGFP